MMFSYYLVQAGRSSRVYLRLNLRSDQTLTDSTPRRARLSFVCQPRERCDHRSSELVATSAPRKFRRAELPLLRRSRVTAARAAESRAVDLLQPCEPAATGFR